MNTYKKILITIICIVGISFPANADELATPSTHFINQGIVDDGSSFETYLVIEAIQEAELTSPFDGKINKIHHKQGESFLKDDFLVEFDCKELQYEVKSKEAELSGAKAEATSNKQLAELDSISEVELKQSLSKYEQLDAELRLLKTRADKCIIKAPYDGQVVSQEANEHETVKIDDPLISIINNTKFEIKMFIPSEWLSKVNKGTKFIAKVQEIGNDTEFNATVTKIVGKIDSASQSALVFADIDDTKGHNFYDGMSGYAKFLFDADKGMKTYEQSN